MLTLRILLLYDQSAHIRVSNSSTLSLFHSRSGLITSKRYGKRTPPFPTPTALTTAAIPNVTKHLQYMADPNTPASRPPSTLPHPFTQPLPPHQFTPVTAHHRLQDRCMVVPSSVVWHLGKDCLRTQRANLHMEAAPSCLDRRRCCLVTILF